MLSYCSHFFFYHTSAPTDISTLSLHDARSHLQCICLAGTTGGSCTSIPHPSPPPPPPPPRSDEHTSELQSRRHLVCRLLLPKKNILCSFPLSFSSCFSTLLPSALLSYSSSILL